MGYGRFKQKNSPHSTSPFRSCAAPRTVLFRRWTIRISIRESIRRDCPRAKNLLAATGVEQSKAPSPPGTWAQESKRGRLWGAAGLWGASWRTSADREALRPPALDGSGRQGRFSPPNRVNCEPNAPIRMNYCGFSIEKLPLRAGLCAGSLSKAAGESPAAIEGALRRKAALADATLPAEPLSAATPRRRCPAPARR
jgi:hypothetical protein